MATPINRIKIQEKDLTSAGFSAAATDIVYVPGLSALNDQIVFSEPGVSPFNFVNSKLDTNKVFINAADEVSWKFDAAAATWLETPTYVEPHPENVPVLCETVQEFEAMFGAQPFVFDAPVPYFTCGEGNTYDKFTEIADLGELKAPTEIDTGLEVDDGDNNEETTKTIKFAQFSLDKQMPEAKRLNIESSRGDIEGPVYSVTANGIEYKCVGTVALVTEVTTEETADGNKEVKTYGVYTYDAINKQGSLVSDADGLHLVPNNLCGFCYTANEVLVFVENSKSVESINVDKIFKITEEETILNGFSTRASTVSAMFKEDTADLSYVYAKTLIKLGLPVAYENITIRDNEFPLASSFTNGELDGEGTKVVYSYDGLRVISIDGKMQCTGEKSMNSLDNVQNIYKALLSETQGFSYLLDKGEYTVKYITSGGYPTFEYDTYSAGTIGYNAIAQKMINIAAERGDSVAIIDHTNKPERPLSAFNSDSVFNALIGGNNGNGNYKITASAEFGTMFTPWALYSGLPVSWEINGVNQNSAVLPASFGYLVALAKSIRTNANWLAIAGAARGQVPYINSLNTLERLSNTIADSYQSRDDVTSVNAITDIKPYGLTIWGNRTLKDNADMGNLTATSFLNLRNLVSDIKKTLYTACKSLLFEQNNDTLWVNFKMKVTPLLDQMQSGAGISGYKLIKGSTTEKAKLVATVKIYPIYAIEEFDVTVEISDQEVSVS